MPNQGKIVLYFAAALLIIVCGTKPAMSLTPTHEVFIRATGGRNVQLNVNSFARYNNGYTLENWTRLVIEIPPALLGPEQPWSLYAFAGSDQLRGDMFDHLLNIDYLTLTASSISVNLTPTTGGRLVSIERGLKLADGIGPGRFEILISYSIGTEADRRLLGKPADHYFTDIWFQVFAP